MLDGTPVLNEFMASNDDTLLDGDGNSSDWIEIHNAGDQSINLSGWHLTDDAGELTKWTFPDKILAANEYFVLFASGQDVDDYVDGDGNLHTNFKLGSSGEYLGLVQPDGTVEQEFSPTYPEQYRDVSYGLLPGGSTYVYFTTPTPEDLNSSSVQGFVQDTTFSHDRGFYEATFQLDVTTATPGATIYYTTDGSTPDASSAHVDAPDSDTPPVLSLNITTTTIVRAYAAKPDYVNTNIDTQTYLFLDQVIAHPNMDESITEDPVWGPQMRDALLEIPSISLVTQEEVPTEPILNPPEIGASIEMFFPDGSDGWQADVAIERFGRQYTLYPKHALRVSFKEIHGPKRLNFDLFSDTPYGGDTAVESFDQILLRNGSHDSLFADNYSHSRGTYIRNRYSFDRQLEAGHLSMRGTFVHVYLNGEYYGHYHLMERPTADFMATYQGGEEEDYDIMKGRDHIYAIQGNSQAWDHLVANTHNWEIVQDYMDVDNYIDYMLLNFYGGNDHDWYPGHNWVAGRKREAGAKFQFFMWDNDFLYRRGGNSTTGSTANTVDNGGPGNMLSELDDHLEFRIRMADRAQRHFFNGGMLTPERVQADFTELAQSISRTIIPETARWADDAPVTYTPDDFQRYVDWIVNVNAPTRTDVVIGQMRAAGLFPTLDAPSFSQHGGTVPNGYELAVSAVSGPIHYTVDGTDPRLLGGAVNPNASVFGNPGINTSLVESGAEWRYLDDGSNQGTDWYQPGFDDAAWDSGNAQLGYGEGDEQTVVSYGPNASNKYITTYFRHTFQASGVADLTDLTMRLLRDDGAVVYLNGAEVRRPNMPSTPITYTTLASSTVSGSNETTYFEYTLDPAVLVEGENVIAIEMHQATLGSSDLSFDMELIGNIQSGGVIPITATTHVMARVKQGSEWSALTEATFVVHPAADATNLAVSEIHFKPHAALTQFGEANVDNDQFEFIEVSNVGSETINLLGVTFTAGVDFTFGDLNLGSGEQIVVVRNVTAFESRYGTGSDIAGIFQNDTGLSNNGETIRLADGTGVRITEFTYDTNGDWPDRADGLGSSIEVIDTAGDYDAAMNWRASRMFGGTPGAAGNDAVDVIVNEVLAHTDLPAVDAIELYNTSGMMVDLSGWWLSDSSNDYFKYQFPAGTTIASGTYVLLDESNFNSGGPANPAPFALGSDGDDIWLLETDGTGRPIRFADAVAFDATLNNVTLGRVPNGTATFALFPLAAESLEAENGPHLPGGLVMSEVHYHPADPPAGSTISEQQLEFVEIYNRSDADVVLHDSVLGDWRLRGGVDFDFDTLPAGTTLTAGAALVVVSFDPSLTDLASEFRSIHGIGPEVTLIGPYDGQLSNAGETVRLLAPTAPPAGQTNPVHYLVDRVIYDDVSPWPAEPDGTGLSLARIGAEAFGDEAASWQAATPTPGTVTFVAATGDFDTDGDVDGDDLALWESGFGTESGANLPDGDADADGDVDGNDFLNWQLNFGSGTASGSGGSAALASGSVDSGQSSSSPTRTVDDGSADSAHPPTTRARSGSAVGLNGSSLSSSTGQPVPINSSNGSGTNGIRQRGERSEPQGGRLPTWVATPEAIADGRASWYRPADIATWSLPLPVPTTTSDTTPWLNLPQFQLPGPAQPFQRGRAVDAVMLRLDQRAERIDLERVHGMVEDVTLANFTAGHDEPVQSKN